jgi:hypothetical protein
MPCVCRVCALRFDRQPDARERVLHALICEDCQAPICPNCMSHDVYDLIDFIVDVPLAQAASVRASVWGRGS